jgi:tetrahydromethanopterin S-methyltransferase subunit F
MGEEETKAAAGGAIRMGAIDAMVENIRYKAQILARTNKMDSALMGSGLVGFAIGLVFALIFIVVPALVL